MLLLVLEACQKGRRDFPQPLSTCKIDLTILDFQYFMSAFLSSYGLSIATATVVQITTSTKWHNVNFCQFQVERMHGGV